MSRLEELIESGRSYAPTQGQRSALRARVWSAVARTPVTTPRFSWARGLSVAALVSGALLAMWGLASRPDHPPATKASRIVVAPTLAPIAVPVPVEAPVAPPIATPPIVRRRLHPIAPAPRPDEAALLLAARRARSDDPAAALEILEQHRVEYPNGRLAEEREMLAIDLLMRTHQREQARARAVALVERWPESAYRERAERILTNASEEP